MSAVGAPPGLRWQLADRNEPQLALFGDVVRHRVGKGEYRGLEFFEVEAKRIINELPNQGFLPFRYTINAYRGCSHACTYCFARPSHEYLGFDAGRDFEQKIVVKINAVELLEAETAPGRWVGDLIAMGTNTDPYQPAEAKYHLTQEIAGVLSERRNDFSILTKSPLVLRDLDLLAEAASRARIHVDFSIGTLDEEVWRATEPGTPHPRRRVEAVAKLNAAGVPSGVLIAPVLPGLSDQRDQIEEVVEACVEAGATFISPILLHLRPVVREEYLGWLAAARPDLLDDYERIYGDGSYAPRSHQRRIAGMVRELVAKYGGPVSERSGMRRRPAAAAAQQLRLGV